jgi:sigma-B regulation protein RsbU (phosphoserine phosphatase)
LTRRFSRLHWLLAGIFFITAAVDSGEITVAIRQLREGPRLARLPFSATVASRLFEIAPHYGWRVLAIDGKPFTRGYQELDINDGKRPGDRTTVTMQSPLGQVEEVHLIAESQEIRGSALIRIVANYLFLPVFCLVLGFVVAAIRTRDPLAWLLLALLLSFAEATHVSEWRWPARDWAITFQGRLGDSWPIWMMLFGIYFPNRLKIDERFPWAKWLLIAPLAFVSVAKGFIEMVWFHDIDASLSFRSLYPAISSLKYVLGILSLAVFFCAMVRRSFVERDKDARRRIALLWTGASAGLAPAIGIVIYGLVTGQNPGDPVVPLWIGIPALLLLSLFPLTLAYVIVVQRAMNLRVAIRLGVQYTLARGGLWVFRVIVVNLAIYAMAAGGPHRIARIVGLGALLIVLRGSLTGRVSTWLDRRFFREAYSAERVLSELSEEARQFTETGPLLETVTSRVANTLHIPKACVLLRHRENYCVVNASGKFDPGGRCLPSGARSVEHVRESRKPALIYFDDANSWVQQIEPEEKRKLQAFDAQVLLPLAGREDLAGIMVLGPKLSEEPYSGADLRLLQSVASQTALALENSVLLTRLSAEAARRERLNRDLEIAGEVQQRLFPQSYPAVEGIDYYGYCRPALGIGGDYYDFVQLRNGKLGIAIGDISGKGVAAALLMANLQASLRGQTLAGVSDLSALMCNINQMMYEASSSNRYATFFYGEYCPQTRRLDFVNAGHNAPFVLRGGNCLRLEACGPVVGLLKQVEYEQTHIDLEHGDVLLGFTDGISEAMTTGEEEWEEERLLEALRHSRNCPAKEIVTSIFDAADSFTKGATQYDDMTLVVLKVL